MTTSEKTVMITILRALRGIIDKLQDMIDK